MQWWGNELIGQKQMLLTHNRVIIIINISITQVRKMVQKLKDDIIETYKPFENTRTQWKTQVVSGHKFEVYNHFQILNPVQLNAHSTSVIARDSSDSFLASQEEKYVIIKKIENAFHHKIFAKQTLRKIKLMKNLRHQNILSLQTILFPKSREQLQHVYCVSKMMPTNLRQILKSNTEFTEQHIKYFLYQTLKGLKHMHASNVIHNDLRPCNLLLDENCGLKICGLSSAWPLSLRQKNNFVGEQMGSLNCYKSPQVLLNIQKQSKASDIWSVGCIFGELLLKKPIFHGLNMQSLLESIFQYFSAQHLSQLSSSSEQTKKFLKQAVKNKNKKNLQNCFSPYSESLIDLLQKMLRLKSGKRITAEQALKHQYFSDLTTDGAQPLVTEIDPIEFQYEGVQLTTEQLKDLIYEQILLYNSQEFRECYEERKKKGGSLIKHIVQNSNKNNLDERTDSDQ